MAEPVREGLCLTQSGWSVWVSLCSLSVRLEKPTGPTSKMSHSQTHMDAISKRFIDPVHWGGSAIGTEATPKNKGPRPLYFFRVQALGCSMNWLLLIGGAYYLLNSLVAPGGEISLAHRGGGKGSWPYCSWDISWNSVLLNEFLLLASSLRESPSYLVFF